MSYFSNNGGWSEGDRARQAHWAAKREERLAQEAKDRAAFERFCGMLGGVGQLR
jgi:hypothetical protein